MNARDIHDLGEHARRIEHAMLTACYHHDNHAAAVVLRGELDDVEDDRRAQLLDAVLCNAVAHHAATLHGLEAVGFDVDSTLDRTKRGQQ